MSATKLTGKAAIEKVLENASGPMTVTEIADKAIPMSNLSGATPKQTVYSILYGEVKKGTAKWRKVGKGTFEATAGSEASAPARQRKAKAGASSTEGQPEATAERKAKPDPRPVSKRKPRGRKVAA